MRFGSVVASRQPRDFKFALVREEEAFGFGDEGQKTVIQHVGPPSPPRRDNKFPRMNFVEFPVVLATSLIASVNLVSSSPPPAVLGCCKTVLESLHCSQRSGRPSRSEERRVGKE